ncbi:iron-containing redox enzyme family protein [Glaciimonas sp. GG7]
MNTNDNKIDFDFFFKELDVKVDQVWKEIFSTSGFINAIESGQMTKELYAIYMVETFHYTSHNARNQALVGTRENCNSVYSRFCYEHAAEEVGHEKMALHDVLSIGLKDIEFTIPRPLPETETLIAYLYWISLTGNPLQRLGYSYWAENCYAYINPMIAKVRNTLMLEASQLTFFIAHSDIDADHFNDVKNIIRRTCKTRQDIDSVVYAMDATLRLTGKVLEAVYLEYEKFKSGASLRYAFLAQIDDA